MPRGCGCTFLPFSGSSSFVRYRGIRRASATVGPANHGPLTDVRSVPFMDSRLQDSDDSHGERKKARSCPMTHLTFAPAPSCRDTNHSENSEDERSDQ